MGLSTHERTVQTTVRDAISAALIPPQQRAALLSLLTAPGQVLAPRWHPRWSAFVLESCAALGGDVDAAVPVAGAMELVASAADVLDDVLDDDLVASLQARRALNATVTLVWLALRMVLDVNWRAGVDHGRVVAGILIQGAVASHGGEDLDLLLESDPDADELLSLQMTARKSGNLVGMACHAGAALATHDSAALRLVQVFGYRVGVVAQLLNDMAGVDVDPDKRGSDIRWKKKTLPVTYMLRCAREEGLQRVLDLYMRDEPLNPADEQEVAELIHDLGGLHYTWVVADAWRREALAGLRKLAEHTGCELVMRLRRLVPSVRAKGFVLGP